jgi:hypothetical protein
MLTIQERTKDLLEERKGKSYATHIYAKIS